MKKVLSVAGSDCSGGAGIQADLKTFSAHGVYGMSVIVSVVAENTSRVIDIEDISPEMILKQMDAVYEDIEVDAVKVGMMSAPCCMDAVGEGLRKWKARNVVVDPVMYAKDGSPLMDPGAIDLLIDSIIPMTELLTPNIPEAETIARTKIETVSDMKTAAEIICGMGCRTVLIKGGHREGAALDILFDGKHFYDFETPRIQTKNTHGTGCTLSSAIAANLALGMTAPKAVGKAKDYITMAISHSLSIGKGHGPVNHFHELYTTGLEDYEG